MTQEKNYYKDGLTAYPKKPKMAAVYALCTLHGRLEGLANVQTVSDEDRMKEVKEIQQQLDFIIEGLNK